MNLFFLFLACGEKDTTIDATQYDQTCSVDEDCMSVFTGNVCGCNCTSIGINVADIESYNAERDELYNQCAEDEIFECMACPNTEAYCEEGTCKVQTLE